LCAGSKMLPAQEPVHKLRRGYRLNLPAQGGHGEAMNPGQQAALAPLGFRFRRRLLRAELRSAWTGEGARPHTAYVATGDHPLVFRALYKISSTCALVEASGVYCSRI